MGEQPRPGCEGDAESWDLEHMDTMDMIYALKVCITECPIRGACKKLTADQIQRGATPNGIIQAGRLWPERTSTSRGKREIDKVRKYAPTLVVPKNPTVDNL